MPAMNAKFYDEMGTFTDFSEVASPANYQPAPDDWFVVIADIKGSTAAIAEGRYKDVNMIGAACINAVLNCCECGEIPYVFGGDGAKMLIPEHRIEDCKKALLSVQFLAKTKFNLALRVGVVTVKSINATGIQRVLVGKYQLSPNNALATFSGGGIELAESWIKSNTDYQLTDIHQQSPDLSGLYCRWEPLASNNGVMLSILVQAQAKTEGDKERIYRSIIQSIGNINPGDDSPVTKTNLKLRWPPRGIQAEINATVGNRNPGLWACKVYLYSLLQWCLDRFDLTLAGYRGKQYRVELRNNTDYQRFDDTLRILLDCSSTQADEIDAMLDQQAKTRCLHYGLHRADSALMTCLVFNLDKAEHIHFVDGNNGGFTSAARALKAKGQSIPE
ncbi:MAG: hypothetical protein ACI9KN_000392 [Gammaproteobacteria bacterium]|jgi:hypothetical protein